MSAAIRSVVTYLAVALYVAIAGPPLLLIAILFGQKTLLYRAGHLGVKLGLALSGIKTVVEGGEHLQRQRAAVYAVNHTSNVEPPVIFDALHELFPRLRVLYKAELRKLPILVRAFDLAGFVPLERGNRDQSLPAIEGAAAALRDGNSFLIFPEGTRSRTGALLPFKKGGSSWRSRRRLRRPSPSLGLETRCGRGPWIQPVRIRIGSARRSKRPD